MVPTNLKGHYHSDLSVINVSRIMPLPLVIGHEGSGEVVELGSAVKDIKIGVFKCQLNVKLQLLEIIN